MATATKKNATRKSSTKSAATTSAHATTSKKKPAATKSGGKKSSAANACWPGYEPTPGKAQGEKGSCKPKKRQTSAERKGDQKAHAAATLSGQRS